jgi:hypothetical protein
MSLACASSPSSLLSFWLLASATLTSVRAQAATRCDPNVCRIPDCYCGGTEIPGGLHKDDIPQFVLLTFDDAVNDLNKEFFARLFKDRFNPNDCPIKVGVRAKISIFSGFEKFQETKFLHTPRNMLKSVL